MTKDVAEFYDDFSKQQLKTGVNSRHLSILSKVVNAGLKPHHYVLEVGCGIGTVSQLLAKKVRLGRVLAVDISPESIRHAKHLWAAQKNLTFEVSDMTDFEKKDTKFDFVVFPDVLEHIPVEQHAALFNTIQRHSTESTVVFVHIPAPRFLTWMQENEVDKLQVIDQALNTGKLITDFAQNGFFLDKMETYGLFYWEKDYQYFVFRRDNPIQQVSHKPKWKVLIERIGFRSKLL